MSKVLKALAVLWVISLIVWVGNRWAILFPDDGWFLTVSGYIVVGTVLITPVVAIVINANKGRYVIAVLIALLSYLVLYDAGIWGEIGRETKWLQSDTPSVKAEALQMIETWQKFLWYSLGIHVVGWFAVGWLYLKAKHKEGVIGWACRAEVKAHTETRHD